MTKHHARLTHPHTGAPILPLGYRRNGAPIWPILGASPDDEGGADSGTDTGDGGDTSGTAGGDVDGAADDDGDDGADQLGDAGKQALDRMKSERNDARRENRRLKAELEAAKNPPPADGGTPDAEAIKAEARREAIAEANQRVVRAELKAAATGKLADPGDALTFLDLTQFEVDADGNVDAEELTDAISELLKKKPYLAAQGKRFEGGADGGTRKGSAKSIDDEIAEATAAGDIGRAISLKRQKAYANTP
jgi:hypothetical protein